MLRPAPAARAPTVREASEGRHWPHLWVFAGTPAPGETDAWPVSAMTIARSTATSSGHAWSGGLAALLVTSAGQHRPGA